MATDRSKIEHLEHAWAKDSGKTWKNWSKSRKRLKAQMNRFIRRKGKRIDDGESGFKKGRKPTKGWEY